MTVYTTPCPSPALEEIHRRHAEPNLRAVMAETGRIDLLGIAIGCAAQDAVECMNDEAATFVGERYERCTERRGYRNGTAPGYVVIGGRKVMVRRPRVVDARGKDIPLASCRAMQDPRILDEAALGKVIDGVSQRDAHGSFERDQPLPEDQGRYGDSKSSISRRWIAATGQRLRAVFHRPLDDRRYVAILLDGKGFGEHLLVCAMGIDEQGEKHVLGIRDGGSESEEVCAALLQDMMDRGLDVRRGVLVVIDGGKGLAAAVNTLWGGTALVGRCQEHKKRNVLEKVPKGERKAVKCALNRAWNEPDPAAAKQQLLDLAADLESNRPEAAASLREGLSQTVVLQQLGLSEDLGSVLGTTNLIETACTQLKKRRLARRFRRLPGQLSAAPCG